MKICMRFLAILTAAGCVLPACGPADSEPSGTGGSTGSGGHIGSGGSASGGATGSGGDGSGGVSGTGGAGSGGNGSGGSSSGGSNSGGTTGTGGNGPGGSLGSGGQAMGGRAGAGTGGAMGGTAGGGRAGASGTGGSNGGSTGTYNPCPKNGDPCRILPVGDSITFGINYEGSYRPELFHKALMAGQKITYTGTLMNGPSMVDGMPFPKRYEATSGITIDGISSQITRNNTLAMPSDIIIVHIGTNDISNNLSGSGDRLGKLLDKLATGMPNALIVVCKIIPFTNAEAYNAMIPGVVQTRVAAGKHMIIVDLFTGFKKSDMDFVHPLKSGYDWMGDKLYDALGSLFPK